MYSSRPGLILGFHGCDRAIAERVVSHQSDFRPSNNAHDWLGHGMYFWEHNPGRALDFAKELQRRPLRSKVPIEHPAVLGAVIDLGHCLDLLDHANLALVKLAYEVHAQTVGDSEWPLANKAVDGSPDLLLRDLDCAVIEGIHVFLKRQGKPAFDSVRSVFEEGDTLYPGAGFKAKSHIQICVRNPNCIKGFFLPRTLNDTHPKV